jgi:hypothetical protein
MIRIEFKMVDIDSLWTRDTRTLHQHAIVHTNDCSTRWTVMAYTEPLRHTVPVKVMTTLRLYTSGFHYT